MKKTQNIESFWMISVANTDVNIQWYCYKSKRNPTIWRIEPGFSKSELKTILKVTELSTLSKMFFLQYGPKWSNIEGNIVNYV